MRPPAGKRALIALVLCVGSSCLLGTGSAPSTAGKLAFSPNKAMEGRRGTLMLAERVAYQYAIEEVYWRHRIWPKDNPRLKPLLDAVMSREQVEKKVADYLNKSQFVANHGGWPITASELQSEMGHMAAKTKQPEVLRELFQALGNDPFVIAECLARPVVAERLVSELKTSAKDASFRAESRNPAAESRAGSTGSFDFAQDDAGANADNPTYRLPGIPVATGCGDDTWSSTTTINAPDGRIFHTAVWTGSELIVWGGVNSIRLNTGAKYSPITDSWAATSLVNAPTGRDLHTAVWTGTEMIVWGGEPILNDGGRYNPATDSWVATSTANAPVPRARHSAVWTGSEMVVWGGRNTFTWFNSGGRYNPSTDGWTPTSMISAPEARWYHTVEWTGSEMIVWGGTNQTIYLNTGGRYNPTSNNWMATSTSNAPLGRVGHTSIWSGTEMSVWGGTDSTFNDTNTGGRYGPSTNSWAATSLNNAPSPRDSHAAVWTGTEMIIWGGIFCCPPIDFNTGGRYNAGTDSWTPTITVSAPFARYDHTAVWTGSEMIVWGGYNYKAQLFLNTGGRYCAQSEPMPTPTATPSATATPMATPTATPRITPTPRSRPAPEPRP